MALIYFYDATKTDEAQLSEALRNTDHHWEYVKEPISLEHLDPETEVISIFVTSTVTREMIEKLPKLRLIACRSTGFNNVDMRAAEEREITVVNVPTYGEATVAEYAFGLLLTLTRKLSKLLVAEHNTPSQQELLGQDLSGKTIGIVGTGHIGQHVIKIARGFSMRVIAYDAFPNEQLATDANFTYVSLEEFLAQADVVTLHVPLLPSTHHIIGKTQLELMKPDALLINTARGELIDTSALIESLESGHLGGAALDVVEGESLLSHHEEIALLRSEALDDKLLRHSVEISALKKMSRVIISPHNAFNTIEAVGRINQTTAQNIIDFWYQHIPNKVTQQQQPGKLLIARHAESEWNATGQWTGITDVHLSEKGFRESAQLGRALKQLGTPVDIAYCSEQIRTRETLEGMLDASQQFEVDIVRSSALNERDYGDYTGKNKWEMQKILGEEAFNNLRRGWDVAVPNGETLKMVYERTVPFYEQTIVPLLRDGKNVLLVAHGNSIRALMKYIETIPDENVGELEMLFGTILCYETDESGKVQQKDSVQIDSKPPNA